MMNNRLRNTNVIGVCSTGHGAALALASSRYGVRAITLDRVTKHKHSLLFTRQELYEITRNATPIDRAIHEALTYAYHGFPRSFIIEDTFLPFLRVLLREIPLRPEDIDLVVTGDCSFGFNAGRVGTLLNNFFPRARVFRGIEHHSLHQWQAFLPSGFPEAAVLTVDESGEPLGRLEGRRLAMTMAAGSGTSIEVLREHCHPHSSPGLLYADFSRHIGYYAGEEGKTMGLAPYGSDSVYRQLVGELTLREDGSFGFLMSDELCAKLHTIRPRRRKGEPIEPVHADLAHAAQRLLEDILTNAMLALARMTPGMQNVCLAGGVALNSCANERIFRASPFRQIYICPNPGDDGQALAAALYGARVLVGQNDPQCVPTDYLGPEYPEQDIIHLLRERKIKFSPVDADEVASILEAGLIVGLFQGRSEFGPRALGNRSILADPRRPEMTTIVNERVKHRELFRPYAPVVLEEMVSEWFEHRGPSPFMLRVVPVRSDKRPQLGAITHIDGSARLQTVNRDTNPRLCGLIEAFARRTGVPVLLNTSFNVAGKPIVETAEDALECFLLTGLDALILGGHLIVKTQEARDSGRRSVTPEMLEARRHLERLKDHAMAVSR